MINKANHEELLICRCADCGIERRRDCNSNRLKDLLGNLFDDAAIENFQGLYCRKEAGISAKEAINENSQCLCGECELAKGNLRYFCKSGEIPNEKPGKL